MNTDITATHLFLGEAHRYAIQLMENGTYILKQLPSLEMPGELRRQLESLCGNLIGTKHDLIHEIHELSQLAVKSPGDPAIREGIDRMCQWINESNGTFKAGVDAVYEAMNAGEVDGLLSLLLTESGVNILRATPRYPAGQREIVARKWPDEGVFNKKSRGFSASGLVDSQREVLERGLEPPRVTPLDP